MSYTRTWQERIPTNMRFGYKVQDAITDVAGTYAYTNNIMRNWYEHVNQEALSVLEADQDWQNTIKTWEATAEYMIDKRDA